MKVAAEPENAVSFPRTVAILKLVIVAFKLTKGVDLLFTYSGNVELIPELSSQLVKALSLWRVLLSDASYASCWVLIFQLLSELEQCIV